MKLLPHLLISCQNVPVEKWTLGFRSRFKDKLKNDEKGRFIDGRAAAVEFQCEPHRRFMEQEGGTGSPTNSQRSATIETAHSIIVQQIKHLGRWSWQSKELCTIECVSCNFFLISELFQAGMNVCHTQKQ